jgi:hypothetical protein
MADGHLSAARMTAPGGSECRAGGFRAARWNTAGRVARRARPPGGRGSAVAVETAGRHRAPLRARGIATGLGPGRRRKPVVAGRSCPPRPPHSYCVINWTTMVNGTVPPRRVDRHQACSPNAVTRHGTGPPPGSPDSARSAPRPPRRSRGPMAGRATPARQATSRVPDSPRNGRPCDHHRAVPAHLGAARRSRGSGDTTRQTPRTAARRDRN